MKIRLGIACVVIIVSLSGCGLLPLPEDTVGTPKQDIDISADNDDTDSVVAGFLPEGASLVPVKYGNEVVKVSRQDIDGDGTGELVAIYKDMNLSDASNTKIMILKKGQKTWEKLYDKSSFFTGMINGPVKNLDFKDITGDGAPEVFVCKEQSLEVYILAPDISGNLVVGGYGFNNRNNYEVLDIPGADGCDGMTELLLKRSPLWDQWGTKIFRWNGFSLSEATEEYPQYLKEEVDYRMAEAGKNPTIVSKWWELEYAQEKAGKYEDALKSCDKIMEFNKDPGQVRNIKNVSAQLFRRLGRYDEAMELYKSMGQNDSAILGIGQIYEAMGEYERAREIYKSISPFPYDENVQRIDAIEGEEKIFKYIERLGPDGMERSALDLQSFGKENNIVISDAFTKESGCTVKVLCAVDYHINPSKAYGKENVGGHFIYWWEGEKLRHQGYLTILYSAMPVKDGAAFDMENVLNADFTAGSVELYEESTDTVLKVVYNDKGAARTVIRIFRMKNGRWKYFWK